MTPGEILCDCPDLELNAGRPVASIEVANTGDRPIQVGSHFHFFEVNAALVFDRAAAYGMRLDPDFVSGLKRQIATFNEYAQSGKDEDYRRGDAMIDLFFHGEPIDNPYPNPTMHPISDTGPYYATIVAPSAIESKGGPRANPSGQILGADGDPVPGLYGVGNCVASATGQAYLSGGITFGPYITYGYLAAKSVVAEPVRTIGTPALA